MNEPDHLARILRLLHTSDPEVGATRIRQLHSVALLSLHLRRAETAEQRAMILLALEQEAASVEWILGPPPQPRFDSGT